MYLRSHHQYLTLSNNNSILQLVATNSNEGEFI